MVIFLKCRCAHRSSYYVLGKTEFIFLCNYLTVFVETEMPTNVEVSPFFITFITAVLEVNYETLCALLTRK
jgi:hypothetical protein